MSFERADFLAQKRKEKSARILQEKMILEGAERDRLKRLREAVAAVQEIVDACAHVGADLYVGEVGPFFTMICAGRFVVSKKDAVTEAAFKVDAEFADDPPGGIFASAADEPRREVVEGATEAHFEDMRWVVGQWNLSFNEALCYLEGEIDLPLPDEMYEGIDFDVQEEFRALFDEPSQMNDPDGVGPGWGARRADPVTRVVTPEGESGIFVPVPATPGLSNGSAADDLPSGEAP